MQKQLGFKIILVAFVHDGLILQKYDIFMTFLWQSNKIKKDMLSYKYLKHLQNVKKWDIIKNNI